MVFGEQREEKKRQITNTPYDTFLSTHDSFSLLLSCSLSLSLSLTLFLFTSIFFTFVVVQFQLRKHFSNIRNILNSFIYYLVSVRLLYMRPFVFAFFIGGTKNNNIVSCFFVVVVVVKSVSFVIMTNKIGLNSSCTHIHAITSPYSEYVYSGTFR